jgi:hypothetical protein
VGSGMFKKTQTELNTAKTSSSFHLPTDHKTHIPPSPTLLRRSAGRRRRPGSAARDGVRAAEIERKTRQTSFYVRLTGALVLCYSSFVCVLCACHVSVCVCVVFPRYQLQAGVSRAASPRPSPHSDRPSVRKYRRLSIVYARSRGAVNWERIYILFWFWISPPVRPSVR